MMTKELIAKPIIKEIYQTLKAAIIEKNIHPSLSLISVGEDPGSEFYIRNIIKKSEKLGIKVLHNQFPEKVSENEILDAIRTANNDKQVNAVMVQKPLPSHINEDLVTSLIAPKKDVDGFTPVNLGKMILEQETLLPCTPLAVMTMLDYYDIELSGKHTVLCGRSLIVGKPLLNMLIGKGKPGNATVTVCHSRTKDLSYHTSKADILITALGIPRFIKEEQIKEGVVIIDVGTNEVTENGKTFYVGDVDYDNCYQKAAAITPVPGGIGSITTAILMQNIVKATLSE